MKIFLGDLVHDWEKVSVWTVPLNIGLVGAYAKLHFPDAEIRLFKHPEELIAACRTENPDVLGLSFYAWNTALDRVVLKAAKEANPHLLTVGGGPCFTVLNANVEGGTQFFAGQPDCDAFVINQGEFGFVELLKAFVEANGDIARLKRTVVPGVLLNDLKTHGRVQVGAVIDHRELDDIPSPYLTGLLDPYVENYIPLLETNRNCPYQCAYCAFGVGKGNKILKFSMERVFAEIDYISAHTKADYLITTDTNFGVLERDEQIAAKMHDCHLATGFPGYLCVVWNKTRPERVLKTAKAFNGLAQVGASMQSLHPDVLAAIKRKNLPLDKVAEIRAGLQSDGTRMFSELIAGLPNQTLESHLDDNRRLMNLDAEVFNYLLRFLPGTEIDTPEMREKYYRGSVWRLQDSAFGVYNGEPVFEGEELALATSAMTAQDVHSIRLIHFFLQMMWGKRFLLDYLQLFKNLGLHPIDMVLKSLDAFKTADGPMGEIHARFEADHALEKFSTYEEMCAYWAKPENLERLRSGDHGKLNSTYSFEILYQFDAFLDLLKEVGVATIKTLAVDQADALAKLDAVLAFTRSRLVKIDGVNPIESSKTVVTPYDFVGWRESNYDATRLVGDDPNGYAADLFIPPARLVGIEKQMRFFGHEQIKMTLRRVFDLNPYDFFYDVRHPADSQLAAE